MVGLTISDNESDYLLLMRIIITENQLKNLKLRRRIDVELPNYILSAYKWLNPNAFTNFDEFLERVIFSASRDFTSDFMGNVLDTEDYYPMWESMKPIVENLVMNQYYEQILDWYNHHR